MVVKFDGSGNNEGPTGIVSFCSYNNADFHKAIRQMFHESPREEIVEVVLTRDGIKARFETRNASK